MALKLIDGDYKRDEESRKPLTVEYTEELLQNAFSNLSAKRKRFYPNKNFGSSIKEMTDIPEEEYAFSYAAQALYGIDGITVKGAKVKDGVATVYLILNDEEKEVKVKLDNNL